MSKMTVKDLVFISVNLAIYIVLKYVTTAFGLLKMGEGGSLNLGVVALALIASRYPFRLSFLVMQVGIALTFILIEPPYVVHWAQFLLDYVFAYGAYALVSVLPMTPLGKFHLSWGLVAANVIRFVLHILSGYIFYAASWGFNTVYNLSYMGPLLIYSVVVFGFLAPRINLKDVQ